MNNMISNIIESLNNAGRTFCDFSVNMFVQVSVLIIVLLIIDFLIRKRVRATFRYCIWMLVFIKLILPPALSLPTGIGNWFGDYFVIDSVDIDKHVGNFQFASEQQPGQNNITRRVVTEFSPLELNSSSENNRAVIPPVPMISERSSAQNISVTPERNIVPENPENNNEIITPAMATSNTNSITWQGSIFLVWLIGVLVLSVLLIQRIFFVKGLIAQSEPAKNRLLETLAECSKELGIKRQIEMKLSYNASSPAVCGLFKPVILIPKNILSKISHDQLKAILIHELSHVKRADLWVNCIQTFLQILYFYNPLLWFANAIVRKIREQAVDEMVLVALGAEAKSYTTILIDIAEMAFSRPALSLRLVGVVESKKALSERIKLILSRPFPKTAKIGLIGLLFVVCFAAILLPMSKMAQPKMTVLNNGPLDIQLTGICPDGYNLLFDPNGKKIETSDWNIIGSHAWDSDEQRQSFVFKIPEIKDQLYFSVFPKIKISNSDRGLGGVFQHILNLEDDPATLVYSIEFDRKYKRRLMFMKLGTPIQYVDLTLRYFYGPQSKANYTFNGPFAFDKTVSAKENGNYEITFQKSNSYDTGIRMRLITNEYFSRNTDVFLYDKDGKRYIPYNKSGNGGSSGSNYAFENIPLSPEEIAAVTIGETPYEITFKNIKIQYKDLKPRTHSEYLDVIAQRLNLEGMSNRELSGYRFNSPDNAIKAIDILQSREHIERAVESIRFNQPGIKLYELDEATQKIIHQTALKWTQNSNTKQYGIMLGLMGKWPEFLDLAIDRLSSDIPQSHSSPDAARRWLEVNGNITNIMLNYRLDSYTQEQVNKFKKLIFTSNNKTILNDIFHLLDWTKSQETTNALWELAQDDRPWIWRRAIEKWYSRLSNLDFDVNSLSEQNKLKLYLVHGIPGDDESLDQKATLQLVEIFTPELAKLDSGAWDLVKRKIGEKYDKKEATKIYINYLRQLQKELSAFEWAKNNFNPVSSVTYLLRVLNVWYDINLGNIGTDEMDVRLDIKYGNLQNFKELLAEAIGWYDGNLDIKPIELAFAGKVIDTSGNPIANSQLVFTKLEDYINERGYPNRRRVEVSHINTNKDGQFSITLDPNELRYEFNVTADGFLKREQLMTHRLDDGRLQYRDRYADENNIIIMQRPGKISGNVLDSNGKPLPGTKLDFYVSPNYSSNDPARNVTTDSLGKFIIDGIPNEPVILSYTKLNRIGEGNGYHKEYGGLCSLVLIKNHEGQEKSGIVLDLSKSICSLELEVKDKDGEPMPQITLYFEVEMPPGTGNKYYRIFSSEEQNSEGIYKFEGLPPGKWHLSISDSSKDEKKLDIELNPEIKAVYQVEFDSLVSQSRTNFGTITLPNEIKTHSADESGTNTNEFTTILNNGVTVELLGLCKEPVEDAKWWNPDGDEIMAPSFEADTRKPPMESMPTRYTFLTKAKGGEDISFKAKIYEGDGCIISKPAPDGTSFCFVKYPDGSTPHHEDAFEKGPLEIGIAQGKWIKGRGIGDLLHIPRSYLIGSNDQIVIQPPKADNAEPDMVTDIWASVTSHDYEFKIICKLKDGSTRESERSLFQYTSTIETGDLHNSRIKTVSFIFDRLTYDQITDYELYYRKYEFARFNNVAFKPDIKNNAQIQTEKALATDIEKGNLDTNTPEIELLSSNQDSDIMRRIIKDEEIDLNIIYQIMNGPQKGRRLLASLYLGTHGDSNSLSYLIDALSDDSMVVGIDFFVEENFDSRMNSVRYWANDSLKKLTGQDFGFVWNDPIEKRNEAIQKWNAWWKENRNNSNNKIFSTALPNGVTVELLGLCESQSEGKQWWKPDGSLLQEAPYDDSWGRAFPKEGEKGYKFAVKFSGLAGKDVDGRVTTSNFKSTNGGSFNLTATKNDKELVKYKDGKVDERIVWFSAAYDESLDKCNIIAGVSLGSWKSEYKLKDDQPNDAVEWAVFKDVPLKPNIENVNKVHKVYLPDLETPDKNVVLDFATGQMLSAKLMENNAEREYFEEGDLAYEYVGNQSGLLCFRGAKLELINDNAVSPLKPDLERENFTVYLVNNVPVKYRIATFEGGKYEFTVTSIRKGDTGGLNIEYRKADLQIETENNPAAKVTLSETDKASLVSMFITIGTTCESIESAINDDDIVTAKNLCESLTGVTQKMKAIAKLTEFEAIVTAGVTQFDLLHQALKEGNIESAKTYMKVIMQLGNNASPMFQQLMNVSNNNSTSTNYQSGAIKNNNETFQTKEKIILQADVVTIKQPLSVINDYLLNQMGLKSLVYSKLTDVQAQKFREWAVSKSGTNIASIPKTVTISGQSTKMSVTTSTEYKLQVNDANLPDANQIDKELIKTGFELELIPELRNSGNDIIIQINTENSEPVETSSSANINQFPSINRQMISTEVLIQSGKFCMVLIGGLNSGLVINDGSEQGESESKTFLIIKADVQNKKGSVEFRVALDSVVSSRTPSPLTPEEEKKYKDDLVKNGPEAGIKRNDEYIWLPVKDNFNNGFLVSEEYDDKRYILVSNKESSMMLSDESWNLINADITQDNNGRFAISLQLDKEGGPKLSKLTSNNISKSLAMIVEGTVISAPLVQSTISENVLMVGNFSEKEVQSIVDLIRESIALD